MTSEHDKQVILDFCTECYDQSLYGPLCRKPCSELSTDDCKMLRLYVANNPENYMFGKMYGIFEYEGDIYQFTWHIHEPKQRFASLSNRMTNIEQFIVKRKNDVEFISTTMAKAGHKAFRLYTPDNYLDGFDLSLRKLMKSIKMYAISEQLCKQIKQFDRKHLEWKDKQENRNRSSESNIN